MDGGRNGGLLEDQMNMQDETLGQNTEVTEPEVSHEPFIIKVFWICLFYKSLILHTKYIHHVIVYDEYVTLGK